MNLTGFFLPSHYSRFSVKNTTKNNLSLCTIVYMIDQPLHIVQVSIFRCHKSAPYYYHNCINQEFSRCQSYADV